ncbi:unnamed protein product [Calicophoron daubneyi]|uniref:Grh/CP2 DB domain-containing protein n=1 Tax=Calicophoron daubneyi TaxID=300641 RepID=A0AAV2TL54_CALDB
MTSPWCFDEADLSTSFDDSMNGIGSDIVNSMFNMRDALSALPVCDEQPLVLGQQKYEEGCNSGVDPAEPVVPTCHKFEVALKAPTSSATRFSEASLTYLNQGQTYELSMNWTGDDFVPIKALVKIRFHEYVMELQEQEHLDSWSRAHPGERMIDVDFARSRDYEELSVDQSNPNTIVCLWNGKQCTVGIRLHCIGTEFTAKKHGGEKGVPFRLQVDLFDLKTYCHLESFASQVKVFKMKGADRKHRTDREKLERKSREGRSVYKPSQPVTKLVYLPINGSFRRPQTPLSPRLPTVFGPFTPVSGHIQPHFDSAFVPPQSIDPEDSRLSDPTEELSVKKSLKSPVECSALAQTDTEVFSQAPMEDQFISPSQSYQRHFFRVRRSSPGPGLSPSPSRRLSGPTTSCLQRRRRPRGADFCMGSCSTCGRTCRNQVNRWIRTSKTRPCCSTWDPPGTRPKQSSWLLDKRRASHSYQQNSVVICSQKFDRTGIDLGSLIDSVSTQTKNCELSTSAESSFGKDDIAKWTLIDKCENEAEVPPTLPGNAPALDSESVPGPTALEAREADSVLNTDTGYSSELHLDSQSDSQHNVAGKQPTGCCGGSASTHSNWSLPTEPHSLETYVRSANSYEVVDILPTASAEKCTEDVTPGSNTPCIRADMTAAEVAEWFRQSSFENLLDKFQTFTVYSSSRNLSTECG